MFFALWQFWSKNKYLQKCRSKIYSFLCDQIFYNTKYGRAWCWSTKTVEYWSQWKDSYTGRILGYAYWASCTQRILVEIEGLWNIATITWSWPVWQWPEINAYWASGTQRILVEMEGLRNIATINWRWPVWQTWNQRILGENNAYWSKKKNLEISQP